MTSSRSPEGPSRRPLRSWDGLVWLGFVALTGLFLWPLFAPTIADRMTIGPATGDFLRQFHPYRAFVARSWAAGQPPLWNPHQYAGTPAWADPQLAVLYPWRLLQAPLAFGGRLLPLWAVQLEAAAHLVLAGGFTYLLGRRLGAGRSGALLAGFSFAFGGYLTGYPLEQLAVLDTAAWLPALLWALVGLQAALAAGLDWRRPALVAALAAALMLLAGHPQTALYGLWAGVAWWCWTGRRLRARRAWLASGAVWMLVAAGLSAPQWLPSAELLGRSARQLDPAEMAAGFPPIDLLQVLAPGGLSQWSPLYLGALPLALALWAGWRLRAARPWLGLAAFAWFVGMGGHNPAFPILLRVLPGMGLFRHQERIAILWSLGLAIAAGLGLDRLLAERCERPGPTRLLAGLAAGCSLAAAALSLRYQGLAVPVEDFCRPETLEAAASLWTPASHRLALAGPLAYSALFAALGALALGLRPLRSGSRDWRAGALLLLCLLELFGANRGVALCPAEPGRLAVDANLAALLPHARDGRVSSEALLPGGPNAASLFGLYDVTGDSPLQLGATADLVEQAPEILWWRLLGVRYAITRRPPDAAPLSERSRAGEAGLYEVQLPVPPAWIARETLCSTPGSIADWARPDLDPQAMIQVEPIWVRGAEAPRPDPALGEPSLMRSEGAAGRAGDWSVCWDAPSAGGEARLVGLDPGRIRVEASLPAPGWLALSSAFDPGWRLSARELDSGERIRPPVTRAYGAILAARLPAGRWELRWTYLPAAVIMGLLVGLVTLGASLWLWRRAEGKPA
ncbi:MAG: hypothetical protein H6648_05850 [Caldilineae bacterium]|nr:hypothetical protein [Chloroflexota bacterium]MCB9176668.1 hypothetical protein [Caldilineae bacterium]